MSSLNDGATKLFNFIIGFLILCMVTIFVFAFTPDIKKPELKNSMDFVRGIEYTTNKDSITKHYLGKTLTNFVHINDKDYTLSNELASSINLELENKKEQKVILIVNNSENRIENIIRK